MGPNYHFYPGAWIWAPWNLESADQVTAGDGAVIDNPAPIRFGSHAIVSQGGYICGATHDYDDPEFPLLAYSMHIGATPESAHEPASVPACRWARARFWDSRLSRLAIWSRGVCMPVFPR